MLRAGVVGVGMMGQHHARVYHELSEEKDVELVGVADKDEENGREIAEKYGVEYFSDHKELAKKELDLVNIVVPTSLHWDVAKDFMEMKTDVLVEKPIAKTIENGRKLVEKADEEDVNLMVGHIERFNPAVLRLKKAIEDGDLGKIMSISATRVGPLAIRVRDVGIIIDLGVHDVDVMSFILGEDVKSVNARAGNAKHPDDVEDHALIMLDYPSGVSGVVETNWLTPHKTRKLDVVGTKGIAYLDYIDQSITVHNEEWTKEYKVEDKEPLKNEIEEFIESCKNGERPLVNGEEGLHVLKVARKALESAEEGEIIEIR